MDKNNFGHKNIDEVVRKLTLQYKTNFIYFFWIEDCLCINFFTLYKIIKQKSTVKLVRNYGVVLSCSS